MKAFVSLTIAAFFAVVSVAHAQNAPNSWTVVLTGKQNAAFQAQKSVKKHTGFAISPDGAWGQSHGFASADAAAARAMSFCRSYMRKGQRDCILFAVNGKVVAPAVVQTKTVQALYKPIDAKAAPSVFGYAPGSFKGNKSAARAEYKALEKNPALRNTMVRDAAFELMLTNRTLMVNENSAFLVWFEPRGGEHHAEANSGVLQNRFKSWIATPNGLVCLFDAVSTNGKRMPDRCLYVDSIQNGKARLTWAHSFNQKRKAHLLARDARFAAAR